MKEMKMKVSKKENQKEMMKGMQEMNLASDFFKCEKCGYTVRMLVLGNYAHCSQCGGTMKRC